MTVIRFVIKGQPASKSNRRKLVTLPRKRKSDGKVVKMPALIKSQEARDYEHAAILQIPSHAKQMLTGKLRMTLRIFYESEQSDLDESVILDVLQAKFGPVEKGKPRALIRRGVYVNDRQVRERHVYHGIDKANPRAEIEIEPLEQQPLALELGIDTDAPKERPMKIVPLQSGREPDPF